MHLRPGHRAATRVYYLVLSVFVLATVACSEQRSSLRGTGSNSVEERLSERMSNDGCRDEGHKASKGGRYCGLAQCLGELKWLCVDY